MNVYDHNTGECLGRMDEQEMIEYLEEVLKLSDEHEPGVVDGTRYGFPGHMIYALED